MARHIEDRWYKTGTGPDGRPHRVRADRYGTGVRHRVRHKRHAAARQDGMHALRHFCASVLLDAGESTEALGAHLGHADPGFTPRIRTPLVPHGQERAGRAVDAPFVGAAEGSGGPQAAPAA
ncbi:hypothetical protein [Streptacidiphilus sp. ASG 303]|uniref:hypothetical protein n=1 Tax=Streptacidiphilus sp. ASG 303 TaxID=2896847 RepID=UPI0027DFFC46|nr:hypothetical protein [Streptacidiphilus sp. ASG 303]